MATFKQVADIQTADMLKLPVPKTNFHSEVIQPSAASAEMVRDLRNGPRLSAQAVLNPRVDNMLRIDQTTAESWRWICGSSIRWQPMIRMARLPPAGPQCHPHLGADQRAAQRPACVL
jgi:hypothetical protein